MSLALLFTLGCRPDPVEAGSGSGTVTIDAPARAAMVPAGPTTVSGTADGLVAVTLDGIPVAFDGTHWEAQVDLPRGVSTLEIAGLDGQGSRVYLRQSVLAGGFGDGVVRDALGVRLNQGGLEAAIDLVGDLLDPSVIDDVLPAINPVYEDSYGLFGWDAVTIEANIEAIQFDAPQIGFALTEGTMALEVTLPSVSVDVQARGDVIGIGYDELLTVTVAEVKIGGSLGLDATSSGALSADLIAPVVDLRGFAFDTSILPGEVEGWLLSDSVHDAVQDLLLEQVSFLVPALLDEQLSSLSVALETELLDAQLALSAGFDRVSIDRDGVLFVADLGANVSGSERKPSAGYLLSGASDPTPSTAPDLAVLLSDDAVNRLMHDLWRAGQLDLTLATADGTLEPLLMSPFGANGDASITIDADLPPVLVQRGDSAVVQFGAWSVRIDTPDGDNGGFLVADFAGEIPTHIRFEDGVLGFELGEPELALMVRDSDWSGTKEALTDLLEEDLPIGLMLGVVNNLEIPVPTIGGLQIPDAAIGRDASETYTSIDMDL